MDGGQQRLDSEDSNGRRNRDSTAMGGGRQWTARRLLDGNGLQWTARQRLESNGRIDVNGQRLDGDGRRGGTSMDGVMGR